MKMFCISQDVETAVGLRLTGIETAVAEGKEEADSKVEQVLKDEKVGILIVTEAIYEMSKAKLDEVQRTRKLPLVVQI